jgi:hypothetical protein
MAAMTGRVASAPALAPRFAIWNSLSATCGGSTVCGWKNWWSLHKAWAQYWLLPGRMITHHACALILASPAFKVKLYVPFARPSLRLMHKLRGNFFVNSM